MIAALAVLLMAAAAPSEIASVDDIATKGAVIVLEAGSGAERLARQAFPSNRTVECFNVGDGIIAVEGGKADALVYDRPYLDHAALNREGIRILDECLGMNCISVGASLGKAELIGRVNDFIRRFRADGTYESMYGRWIRSRSPVMPVIPAPAHPDGKIRIGVALDAMPMGYIAKNGEYWGYDIEFSRRLALDLNKTVELVAMEFRALQAATASGNVDLGIAQLDATEERRKVMLFSDPYIDSPVGIAVRNPDGRRKPFLASAADGFRRAFLDESRWRLMAEGLAVTMEITLSAALLGTILAFPLWLLLVSGVRPLRWLGRGWIEIMQGTPVLVMLMIVFYVVFADMDISPVLVAVLVFGLNFSAYVGEILGSGVAAVPAGQWEAAYALGYTKIDTFRRFVFPQAVRIVLPVYRGMLISMFKETSVVGYITVCDLTRVGDLIRARTYDGFFPLVSTAVIYFALAKLMAYALKRLGDATGPRRKGNVCR